MRYIVKSSPPRELVAWLEMETVNRTYGSMRTEVKRAIRRSLCAEQFGLCAYTMLRITDEANAPRHCHIEHLEAQHPALEATRDGSDVDYANMLACYPAPWPTGEKRSCGFGATRRGNETLPITPLHPDCEQSFRFEADGAVKYLDERAKETINILKLNHDELKKKREAVLQAYGLTYIAVDRYELDDAFPLLDRAAALRLSTAILDPQGGLLAEFCVAIAQVAKAHAAQLAGGRG